MMDITNPDSVRETLFGIARDGARPHIKAGIVKRLREISEELSDVTNHSETCPLAIFGESAVCGCSIDELHWRIEAEIAALEQMP
jgi:hypothetical protein